MARKCHRREQARTKVDAAAVARVSGPPVSAGVTECDLVNKEASAGR